MMINNDDDMMEMLPSTNNEQVKIELLGQLKLEAEFRKRDTNKMIQHL